MSVTILKFCFLSRLGITGPSFSINFHEVFLQETLKVQVAVACLAAFLAQNLSK